ncbi:non-ribosomal peptide synthetase [Jatrophihabitans lederbergiae]|uniref:Amino acid adenylation domain-containing protein n=1 Tax=Jatrophihabitans lederbergiae TaxID=3075547 RepID=A0ABU2JBE3_9ACTN|nr:amino acid adenylation domain-containing protein [Jatrophihabitans sp. DSM 44399]MDT0262308.1 amino acid adenylation domain-containing protein [Jatrophihabitans sp. DSM 44399]
MTGSSARVETAAEATSASIDVYVTSEQQRLLWSESGGGCAELSFALPARFDSGAVRAAWDAVVARHEILRTRLEVHSEFDLPVQVVSPAGSAASGQLSGPEAAGDADRWTLVLPALVTDTAGLLVIAHELSEELTGHTLSADPVQYSEYADWQQTLAGSPEQLAAAAEQVRTTEQPITPFALQAGVVETASRRIAVTRKLSGTTLRGLRDIAEAVGGDLEAVLLAGWQALVARSSASESVVTDVLVPARGDDLDQAVGPYAKWARLIGEPTAEKSIATTARAVAEALGELRDAGDFLPAGAGDDALTSGTGFAFTPVPPAAPESRLLVIDAYTDTRRHPVALSCLAFSDRVGVRLTATEEVLPAGYLDDLANQYLTLLAGVAGAPETPIGRCVLADPLTAVPPLPSASPSRHPQPAPEHLTDTLTHRVHRIAHQHPDRIAVAGPEGSLDYADLDRLAAALAGRLRQRGIGTGDRVGLWAVADQSSVIAMLGVLRSGAAFVPVDPALPYARAALILAAAGCQVLLTGAADTPCPTGVELMSATGPATVDRREPVPPPDPEVATAPAYVLFTSGSAGVPKGVVVTRSALENYLRAAAETYLSDGGGTAVPTSLAFDLTVTSLLLPLGAGQRVVIDPALRELDSLAARLRREQDLTLLKLTPSHLAALTQLLGSTGLAGRARALVIGGEALDASTLAAWRSTAGGTRLINEYGPTEATVGCATYEIGPSDPGAGPVPIGTAFAGADLHVLDTAGDPVPPGVVGELFIGGPGLATGYLDDPRTTAERFLPHSWSAVAGERLYRSGDLVCRRPDGTLLFLGRADDQVKIRGFRVELGEVRATLVAHPMVREAAVVLDTEAAGPPRLIAYLTPTAAGDANPQAWADIQEHLGTVLPRAMIPDTARWVAELPLTVNSKLDVAALREVGRSASAGSPSRPLTWDEARVARHLGELVRAEINDPSACFFAVGGHSMLAIQLIARLNEEFGTQLVLGDLLRDAGDGTAADSVERLAALAVQRRSQDAGSSPLVALRAGAGPVPLFCAHSAGGEVAEFGSLAARLVSGRPVWGLQDPVPRAGHWRIDAAGQRFGATVIARTGGGPADIAGWSMGGLIALETAREVQRAGGRLRQLILIECYPPQVLDQFHAAHPAGARVLSPLAELDQQAQSWPAADRADLARRREWYEVHQEAAGVHRPSHFDGHTLVVFAADQPADLRAAARAEWSRLLPNARFHTVAGDHFSVLADPGELVHLIDDDETPGAQA